MNKTKFEKALAILLIAFLAAGIIFVPAASAKIENEKNWSNPQVVKEEIEKLANAGDEQKQEKAFEKLPPEGQKAIIDGLKVAEVKVITTSPTANIGIASIGTLTKEYTVMYYNYIGQRLFSYYQGITWSYDGSKITQTPYRKITGNTYGSAFWTYKGNINNAEGGGKDQFYYRAYTQGQFQYCITSYGCISEIDPWIETTVYATGASFVSSGR